jgi:hypothetical protein
MLLFTPFQDNRWEQTNFINASRRSSGNRTKCFQPCQSLPCIRLWTTSYNTHSTQFVSKCRFTGLLNEYNHNYFEYVHFTHSTSYLYYSIMYAVHIYQDDLAKYLHNKKQKILLLKSQYIYSLSLFVINNTHHFEENTEVHNINTRTKFDLHHPSSHLQYFRWEFIMLRSRCLTAYLFQ